MLARDPVQIGLTCQDIYGCSVLHYLHLLDRNSMSRVNAFFKQVPGGKTQSQLGVGNDVEVSCSHPTGPTSSKDSLAPHVVWTQRFYASVRPDPDARFVCPKCGERMFPQLARRHRKRCTTSATSRSMQEMTTIERRRRSSDKGPQPFAFHQDKVLSGHSSSPLFAAVARNEPEIVKFLWECNISFENDGSNSKNVLEFAIDCLKPEVVSFLLTDRCTKSEDDEMRLMHRCVSAVAWTDAEKKAQFDILNLLRTSDGQPTWISQGHDVCRLDEYSRAHVECTQRMFTVLANSWTDESGAAADVVAALGRIDQIGVLEHAIVEGHSAMASWCLTCIHAAENTGVLSPDKEIQLVYLACNAKRKSVPVMQHILQHCPRVLDGDQTVHFYDLTRQYDIRNDLRAPLEWLIGRELPRHPYKDREFNDREELGCFLIENNLYLDIVSEEVTRRDLFHGACGALSLAVKQGYWKIAESLLQHGAGEIFWRCSIPCTCRRRRLSPQGLISDMCRPNAPIHLLQTFLSVRPNETLSQPDKTVPSASSTGYWVPSLNPKQLSELVELSRTYPRKCPPVCCGEFTYAPTDGSTLWREPTKNWTVLHEACRLGHEDVVARLLETLGEVLQVPNESSKFSPLALAARSESVANVKALLAHGAQPSWAIFAENFDRNHGQRESAFYV